MFQNEERGVATHINGIYCCIYNLPSILGKSEARTVARSKCSTVCKKNENGLTAKLYCLPPLKLVQMLIMEANAVNIDQWLYL